MSSLRSTAVTTTSSLARVRIRGRLRGEHDHDIVLLFRRIPPCLVNRWHVGDGGCRATRRRNRDGDRLLLCRGDAARNIYARMARSCDVHDFHR